MSQMSLRTTLGVLALFALATLAAAAVPGAVPAAAPPAKAAASHPAKAPAWLGPLGKPGQTPPTFASTVCAATCWQYARTCIDLCDGDETCLDQCGTDYNCCVQSCYPEGVQCD
jgi:hypothetical protein